MSAAGPRRLPQRPLLPRFASALGLACALLHAGCNLPMSRLTQNGPPAPGPLSSAATPPLALTKSGWPDGSRLASNRVTSSSAFLRTAYQASQAAETAEVVAPKNVALDLDTLLRLTCEHNARLLVARERINESQAAYNAALNSCVPQALRKDTFKKPVAEAQLWQRRAELSKVQYEVLLDASDTYFDWLATRRAAEISRDLETYEQKLLKRAKALVDSGEKTAQVLVEAGQTFINARRQLIARTDQQGSGAVAKLTYLLGMNDGLTLPADQSLTPIDIVDAGVPVEALISQAQENGPGVHELQGLAGAIQAGINDARCAQRLCGRTGSAMICGRLEMANSQLQQAQLTLVDTKGKLRAGVEEARSAILSGRDQIREAADAIQHGAETYRITNLRLESESPRESFNKNTYNTVLTSIQQLAQGHANYISAVRSYNKAQVRLLLLIGTYNDCHGKGH
jgi:hypothetical protein